MPDRFLLERSIIEVFGMTGMGKSRWTREYLKPKERVIIMDTQNEHDGILFDDLGAMIDHIRAYRTFRVRTEYPDDFEMLCAIAFAAGNCTLVIEEAQRVLPPSRTSPPDSFLNVVYRGRHPRVSLLLVSQRPTTVHIAARSQWNRIICFRQTEPADVDWITNVSGYGDIDPLHLPQSRYYDISPMGCAMGTAPGWDKKKLDRVYQDDILPPESAENVPTDQPPTEVPTNAE
jgi:DNA helicase HerA-like ATPase